MNVIPLVRAYLDSMKLAIITTVCLTLAQDCLAQAEKEMAKPSIYLPSDVVWKAGPPALPAGAKLAVLEGDPTKEGSYTMRVLLPDGYKIPPHTHPKVEHVTVISGTFHLGMGETFDPSSGQTMSAGTFGHWPA